MFFKSLQMMPLLLMIGPPILIMSSKQWVMNWLMLEMSTIAFIIILTSETKKEKILIFFVFQSLPSLILMMSLFNYSWAWEQSNELTFLFIMSSMFMKMGVFPFNTWMMKFNSKVNWMNLTILLTWQKIIPIMILMKLLNKNNTLMTMSILLIILSVIMVKTTNMKMLASLSSIIHNMWMLIPMFMYKLYSMIYLLSYSMIICMVNLFFIKMNLENFLKQNMEKNYFYLMALKMCSLGGIPPTMGFFLKMTILTTIVYSLSMSALAILMLILSSTINFFVYSQMLSKNSLIMKSTTNTYMKTHKNKMMFLFWFSLMTPIMMVF